MLKKYNITKGNILAHELIGLRAKVVKSTDKSREGIEGIIIDETKNTIKIESNKREEILPKKEVTLQIELPSGEKTIVKCEKIMFRPEDRTKVFGGK
ncbi:MAG: ribonuclease P protein subunit [Candidatus Iainarchaeum archaeon]|uniref:Ribonuclease P protein component 1 n=1 Tax=Candidatus Iainarchaeum sp. TaxID=3101447 RepID=A0A497JH50_9ARCH|nr:MAG: ribonuclease P protein subunit [Candidatus Diapherotrites archaeon]